MLLEERSWALFRPYYEISIRQDRHSMERAKQADGASAKKTLKARLKQSLIDHGLSPAMQGDLSIVRAQARAFHMLDPPISWKKRPALFARVLWMWAVPRASKQRAQLYGPPPGPGRDQILTRLGCAGAAAA
jgi:hypothetical protein